MNVGKKLVNNLLSRKFGRIVVPVPDSGVPAALDFRKSKIPFQLGIIRNHYVENFIEPQQSGRILA